MQILPTNKEIIMNTRQMLRAALKSLSAEMLAKVLKEAYVTGEAWKKEIVAAELFERSLVA
jgi:hypothetical protein